MQSKPNEQREQNRLRILPIREGGIRSDYTVSQLAPHINWVYFYHAWAVREDTDAGRELARDAQRALAWLDGRLTVRAVVRMMAARGEEDDIVATCPHTGEVFRLPMLRQQTPDKSGHCLCLADFIPPSGHPLGVFAVSASLKDPSAPAWASGMLIQTLSDRLAEAGAERLHEEVRTRPWGFGSPGIRPAVGYPCMPDMSLNRILDRILDFSSIGVSLTSSCMMRPHASVSGLIIREPQAHYFAVGSVGEDQIADYARRRGMTVEEIKKYVPCY